MSDSDKRRAQQIYLFLAALFVTALVACNLIANKFISIDLGFKTFVISAGVLPYPITFLITDILSEIYGRKRTNEVVYAGFAASLFVLFILWLGHQFPAIEGSPVNDDQYGTVFQNSWRVISASMLAYLAAQLVDIRIFHFWKNLTKGKHLWLRNNFSTVFSQLVDTTLVVSVIFIGIAPVADIGQMIWDGWTFKILCAVLDTILIYAAVGWFKKRFALAHGQELNW
ncbi:queuosine precursor transporter [Cryomorphaceae bacterium]|nr:queuosine precursor transporter [Cryomorphaceae bacterium]